MRSDLSPQNDAAKTETVLRYRMAFPPDDPESFLAYRAMMQPVFDVEVPRMAGLAPFECRVDTVVLDGVIVSNQRSTPMLFDRTLATILSGGIDEVMVVHYIEGEIRYVVDGTERRVEPGQIAVIDLTRPLRIETGPFAAVTLTISRRLFETRVPSSDEINGAVLRDDLITALLATHMRNLSDPAIGIPQADSAALAGVTLDLLTACLRQGAGRPSDALPSPVTLSTIKAAVEQQLGDPELDPSRLMRQFGLSRATLYRMFEQRGGVMAYITERRVRRGFRLVTDTSSSALRVSEVARRAGFTSATAFGRAFRDTFGMTPREARALAWRPVDPDDSPWRLPKITERFVAPLERAQHDLVQRFVYGDGPEA